MALTIEQATAVNTVIRHLTGDRDVIGEIIRRPETIAALELLAVHAYKALSAGYDGPRARTALEENWPVPAEGRAASPAPRPKQHKAALVLCARCHVIRAEVPVPDADPICVYCAGSEALR